MIAPDLHIMARMLGGEVCGDQILCPGPGHSRRDRSLSVLIEPTAPDCFIVHSFADDDDMRCKDYVRQRLGYAPWKPSSRDPNPCRSAVSKNTSNDKTRTLPPYLWAKSTPISGTAAERYLRECRGYPGPIPATLRYLPPTEKYPPAMIAAFSVANEAEPGILSVPPSGIYAVHLTKLKPDGLGKAGVPSPKIILGCAAIGTPIVLAPPNDLLGLAITEGIEDALSIHAATGLGCWAAGCASRLPALAAAVPGYIEHIKIVGDNDAAGRKYAQELAQRLVRRSFGVSLVFLRAPGVASP
jgi:hypothetical protein